MRALPVIMLPLVHLNLVICGSAVLQFNTKYFYKVGEEEEGAREFFFTTPPAPGPDTPYAFGVIGEFEFPSSVSHKNNAC